MINAEALAEAFADGFGNAEAALSTRRTG